MLIVNTFIDADSQSRQIKNFVNSYLMIEATITPPILQITNITTHVFT